MSTPFLDIQPLVLSNGFEEGLLSIAFHPHFASNGFFFLCFTNTGGNLEVDRYTVSANPDQADPGSRLTVIIVNHPGSVYHYGGQPVWADGYLYISTGDGNDPGDQPTMRRTPVYCWARCCASTSTAERRTPSPDEPLRWDGQPATRSGRSACVTPGALASIG
ncbi:MAG: PQQ-dependent sugar dehydrogenase [Anaerolineae bacterium]|nr:MAG: PQQ-dependent sugar dehydrogenase [Anaerolineae bacterium]